MDRVQFREPFFPFFLCSVFFPLRFQIPVYRQEKTTSRGFEPGPDRYTWIHMYTHTYTNITLVLGKIKINNMADFAGLSQCVSPGYIKWDGPGSIPRTIFSFFFCAGFFSPEVPDTCLPTGKPIRTRARPLHMDTYAYTYIHQHQCRKNQKTKNGGKKKPTKKSFLADSNPVQPVLRMADLHP